MATLDKDIPILIVDDSVGIRTVLETYLRRLGHTQVRAADSIESGLAAFRDQKSRLVFLDMVIGNERGADFAAAALAEDPFVVIAIMTAIPPGHELVVSSIAEGAREFLPKPIQMPAVKSLLERVAAHLDAERPPDASYG